MTKYINTLLEQILLHHLHYIHIYFIDKMIVKLVPTESLQMSASKVTEGGGFKFQEVTVVLRGKKKIYF